MELTLQGMCSVWRKAKKIISKNWTLRTLECPRVPQSSPEFLKFNWFLLMLVVQRMRNLSLLAYFPTNFSLFLEPQFSPQVKIDLLWTSFVAHCICMQIIVLRLNWVVWFSLSPCQRKNGSANTRRPFKALHDSKNWFTFGKIFLVRPILTQRTKLNLWEFWVTKQGIMSIFVPNIKTLCLFIDLIQYLQWPWVNEPVFVLALHISSFAHYHCSYPSGHALN